MEENQITLIPKGIVIRIIPILSLLAESDQLFVPSPDTSKLHAPYPALGMAPPCLDPQWDPPRAPPSPPPGPPRPLGHP